MPVDATRKELDDFEKAQSEYRHRDRFRRELKQLRSDLAGRDKRIEDLKSLLLRASDYITEVASFGFSADFIDEINQAALGKDGD